MDVGEGKPDPGLADSFCPPAQPGLGQGVASPTKASIRGDGGQQRGTGPEGVPQLLCLAGP